MRDVGYNTYRITKKANEREINMNITKEQFILFCLMYEKANEFDVTREDIDLEETENGFTYAATFRDEYNYKIDVRLTLCEGDIQIEVPNFNSDEKEDTEPFFHSLSEEVHEKFLEVLKEKI